MSDPVSESHMVVSNVYDDSNRGGALLTHACVAALKRISPDATVLLVPTSPQLSSEHFRLALGSNDGVMIAPGHPLRIGRGRLRDSAIAESLRRPPFARRVPRPIRGEGYEAIAAARLVVGKGGQLFRDYTGRAGLRSFALSSAPLVIASNESVPTALYGVQIGPYEDDGARRAASTVLRRIDAVIVRDSVSAQIASDLGAPHVFQAPDTVFGIDVSDIKDSSHRRGDRYDVLIVAESVLRSLRSVGVNSLIEVMVERVRSGQSDQIVVTAQSAAGAGADFAAAADVAARCAEAVPTTFLGPMEAGALLGLYSGATVVVSGRIHGGIMALIVGTPALVMCPSTTKARDLFDSVGFSEVSIGPAATPALINILGERLDAIGSDSRFSETDIAARVGALKHRVLDVDQELRSLVR